MNENGKALAFAAAVAITLLAAITLAMTLPTFPENEYAAPPRTAPEKKPAGACDQGDVTVLRVTNDGNQRVWLRAITGRSTDDLCDAKEWELSPGQSRSGTNLLCSSNLYALTLDARGNPVSMDTKGLGCSKDWRIYVDGAGRPSIRAV